MNTECSPYFGPACFPVYVGSPLSFPRNNLISWVTHIKTEGFYRSFHPIFPLHCRQRSFPGVFNTVPRTVDKKLTQPAVENKPTIDFAELETFNDVARHRNESIATNIISCVTSITIKNLLFFFYRKRTRCRTTTYRVYWRCHLTRGRATEDSSSTSVSHFKF